MRSSCGSRCVAPYSPPPALGLNTYNRRGAAVPVNGSPGRNPKHRYSGVQERGRENQAAALRVSTDRGAALHFSLRALQRASERFSQFTLEGIFTGSPTELLLRSHRYRILTYQMLVKKRREVWLSESPVLLVTFNFERFILNSNINKSLKRRRENGFILLTIFSPFAK